MVNCNSCGAQVYVGMNFCPTCGRPIPPGVRDAKGPGHGAQGEPWFPKKLLSSGILLLNASIWCLINGLLLILIWTSSKSTFCIFGEVGSYIFIGFPFLAFAVSFPGALLIFSRKRYDFVRIGAILIVLTGIMAFFPTIVMGILILPMAVLGAIYLMHSKEWFIPYERSPDLKSLPPVKSELVVTEAEKPKKTKRPKKTEPKKDKS